MAKQTYLTLVNRVLNRITQAEITDVTAATGHASMICDMINEAQNELFSQVNWYSLYTTRSWKTATYTASTIAFNDANPDTITDSASGFGDFASGMMILVSGSASNDGVYVVSTAAAGTLTLDTSEALTAEAVGESVTITAMTYAVASNHGRTLDLLDVTNNRVLYEDVMRAIDEVDPDGDTTGNPTHFSSEGGYYRLYPVPAGTYQMRERYFKVPTTLSANTDTSDLPIEVENCLIYWALSNICAYMNKFELSDRAMATYNKILMTAKSANKKILNRYLIMKGSEISRWGIEPPVFPSNYGRYY